jgi:hypothetical protein
MQGRAFVAILIVIGILGIAAVAFFFGSSIWGINQLNSQQFDTSKTLIPTGEPIKGISQ